MLDQQLIENPDAIELNDGENIENILGNPPSWILNWGITLILVSVAILLGISYFIKYPDKIEVQVKITTENPPIRIVSKMSGKITDLKVVDKQDVEVGTILGIMESTASFEDIQILEKKLADFDTEKHSLYRLKIPNSLELGNLQNPYSSLLTKLNGLDYHRKQDITIEKTIRLEEQIKQIGLLNNSLNRQKQTLMQEGELLRHNHERYQALFNEGGASKVELELKESTWLQHKRQVEALESSIINNNIQIEQLGTQILDLGKNTKDGFSSKELSIVDDLKKLKEGIREWKQNYLIMSPITGKVSMPFLININQHINSNEEILVVIPAKERNDIRVEGILPMTSSGKIKNGLKAHIQVDGFPQQEFGTVASIINNISLVPQRNEEGNAYLLELSLSDNLNTNYGKAIPFRQEMEGTASIFTNDKRVLERVFEQLLDLVQ